MAQAKEPLKLIANNKKAYHDYFILEKYECGIELFGTEVKSLRQGKCSIKEAYVDIRGGEVFVCGMNHRFEGGGYQFAPDADATDGVLNLCLANPARNADFYKVFPSVPGGTHYKKWPTIMYPIRGREISVQTSIPLWVHTDGEVVRKADHILIRVAKEKLAIFNP